MLAKFGPSGNSKSFYEKGYSKTTESASYTKQFGLDLFEYSFGLGVRLSDDSAVEIGKAFAENNIEISVHAPYYINFATEDPLKVEKSTNYILQSLSKVFLMGGDRVVVHIGSECKMPREKAFGLIKDNLQNLIEHLPSQDCKICIETMGKLAQIGTVAEVVELCNLNKNFYPCIDFGHLNARERGLLNIDGEYEKVFDYMLSNLPFEKVQNMHVHFSKIMFSAKGEIKHLDFSDQIYGPKFERMLEIVAKNRLSPHILCESDGTQIEDAKIMKDFYSQIR